MAISLSDYIRQLQGSLGLNDTEVAEQADIDLDVYLRYKHGDVQKIHTATIRKIAAALNVDSSDMLRIANVRRRRSRPSNLREERSYYELATPNALSDKIPSPADYAELMVRHAAQLEQEADRDLTSATAAA